MAKLRVAVEKALLIHAHSRDAILQYLVPHFSWRNTTFMLDGCKHLRLIKVREPISLSIGTCYSQEVHNDGKGQIHGAVGALLEETETPYDAQRVRSACYGLSKRSI